MKYAIQFYQTCPILDKANEIIIKYTKKDKELINFIQKYPNQRIIVDIVTLTGEEIEQSLEIFEAAATLGDFAIKCLYKQPYNLFAEINIPFFFEDRVNTIDKLTGYINLGVSDVYITDELGFYLNDIHKLCAEKKVKIRVFPNVAQSSSSINNINPFSKFFIRPEDVEIYENYVDVFEFFGTALDKQPVLYDIYNEGKWEDDLAILIIGLDPITNDAILPIFGPTRVKCNKRCAFGRCEICASLANISKELKAKGIYLTKETKGRIYGTESKTIQTSLPTDTNSAT